MHARRIGDTQVSAIGLGAMPLSVDDGPDEERAVATVHAALDAGVTLIDTADAYGPGGTGLGYNESLVARALSKCLRCWTFVISSSVDTPDPLRERA